MQIQASYKFIVNMDFTITSIMAFLTNYSEYMLYVINIGTVNVYTFKPVQLYIPERLLYPISSMSFESVFPLTMIQKLRGLNTSATVTPLKELPVCSGTEIQTVTLSSTILILTHTKISRV